MILYEWEKDLINIPIEQRSCYILNTVNHMKLPIY